MANYVTDSFTDSDTTTLDVHVPEVGDAWDVDGNDLTIESNQVVTGSIGGQRAVNTTVPASDDYQVSAVIYLNNNTGDINCGIRIRDTGANDGYQAQYNTNDEEWQLINNTFSLIDSVSDTSFAESESRLIVLRAEGDLITLSVNGVPTLSATNSSNTTGVAGIFIGGNGGAGWSLDSFSVDDLGPDPDPGEHVVAGRGSFAVDPLTEWLSTSVADRPLNLSNGAAEPTNWYHVGMLSWGTDAHGAMVAYPVTRDLDLVRIPLGMDTVWYEFASGITATVTELTAP